jgi:hypothetical protein
MTAPVAAPPPSAPATAAPRRPGFGGAFGDEGGGDDGFDDDDLKLLAVTGHVQPRECKLGRGTDDAATAPK